MVGNFHSSVANCFFVIRHLRLPMTNLRIKHVVEIIRHDTLMAGGMKNRKICEGFLPQKFHGGI